MTEKMAIGLFPFLWSYYVVLSLARENCTVPCSEDNVMFSRKHLYGC